MKDPKVEIIKEEEKEKNEELKKERKPLDK